MILQDLDLGESLWPEAKLRATEAGGKVSRGGQILWKIKLRRLEAKRKAITPVTNYKGLDCRFQVLHGSYSEYVEPYRRLWGVSA